VVAQGTTDLSAMHAETPWPSGKYAAALQRGGDVAHGSPEGTQ
jgi:hypothetical protein